MATNRNSGEYQREVSLMVQNEVLLNLSCLVSAMIQLGEDCPDYDDLQTVMECAPDNDDWREAIESEGYTVCEAPEDSGNWYSIETEDCEKIRVAHAQVRDGVEDADGQVGGFFFYMVDANSADDLEDLEDRLHASEADAWEAALSEFGTYLPHADDESEALRECARVIRADDPDPREVFEHWAVSRWLADELEERGEAVTEWQNLRIWGRCTTGQGIALDSVICRIYDDLHKDDAQSPQSEGG